MASEKSEKKEEISKIELPEYPEHVKEIYLIPKGSPQIIAHKPKGFLKIYPLPWWKRWCRPWWQCKAKMVCCCCCCSCGHHPVAAPQPPAPLPQPPAAPPVPATPPPAIDLYLGSLPIGGAFYLLITPQGSVCQFVLEWRAYGGVGQLTVDLDVLDPGASSFRRLATGLGPADSYTFLGARGVTYTFRATVRDSRGQSTFDTETVTTP